MAANPGAIRAGQAYVEIFAADGKFQQAMTRIRTTMATVGQQMRRAGTGMFLGGAAIGAPMALAVRQFAAFDDAVRAQAAAAGKGEANLASMGAAAEQLAMQFAMAATDVATLGVEVARAFGDKLTTDQLNSVTAAVLAMAKATGTQGTVAASIMASTLSQFGLDASEAARVADVLTFTANATLNSVDSLGEALKYAGMSAKTAGLDMEETAAILGTLGNLGVQGSDAGTVLKRLLIITSAEAQKLQQIFGVSFLDMNGNVRPLVDTLGEVATATNNMASGEKLRRMNDAFGLLGISAALGIGRAAQSTRSLEQDIRRATGTAVKQAEFMTNGVGGAMQRMRNAVDALGNAFSAALAPAIIDAAGKLIGLLQSMQAFAAENPRLSKDLATVTLGVTGLGAAAIASGAVISGLSTTVGVLQKIMGLGSLGASAKLVEKIAELRKSGLDAEKFQKGIEQAHGDFAAAGGRASMVTAFAPLLKVIGAIGLGVGAAATAMKLWDGVTQQLAESLRALGPEWKNQADAIRAMGDSFSGVRLEYELLRKAMAEKPVVTNNVSDRELRALMTSFTGPAALKKLQQDQQDALAAAGEEFPIALPDVPARMKGIAQAEIDSINANPRIFDAERERRVAGLRDIIRRLDNQMAEQKAQAAAAEAAAAEAAVAPPPMPAGPTEQQITDAEQVRQENRTPYEKFAEEQSRLRDLLDAKAIDEQTFLRAIAKAEAEAVDEITQANKEAQAQFEQTADAVARIKEDVATPAEQLAARIAELRQLPLDAETFARAVDQAKAAAASAMDSTRTEQARALVTAGTFGQVSMLGVGPELADPARETADNTRRMVDQLAAMAMAAPAPAANAPAPPQPMAVAPPGADVLPPAGLVAMPLTQQQVAPPAMPPVLNLAAPLAAEVAAPRAPEIRQAVAGGAEAAMGTATLSASLSALQSRMVAAIDKTTAAVQGTVDVLKEIAANTHGKGAVFQ